MFPHFMLWVRTVSHTCYLFWMPKTWWAFLKYLLWFSRTLCIGKWVGLQSNILSLLWRDAMVFKSSGKCNEYFLKKILSWSYLNLLCVVRFHIASHLFLYFSKNLAFLHFFVTHGGKKKQNSLSAFISHILIPIRI